MGCGRVGSSLAHQPGGRKGHEVAVIDQDGAAFRRLGSTFEGAGSRASASTATPCVRPASSRPTRSPRSAAVTTPTSWPRGSPARRSAWRTSSPGSTTPAAPRSTSAWASPPSPRCAGPPDQMLRRLLPKGADAGPPGPERPGRRGRGAAQRLLGRASGSAGSRRTAAARVAYLTRLGEGLLPGADTVYQDGDIVHVLSYGEDLDRVERRLSSRRPPTDTSTRRTSPEADRSDARRHHRRRKRRALDRPRADPERPQRAAGRPGRRSGPALERRGRRNG